MNSKLICLKDHEVLISQSQSTFQHQDQEEKDDGQGADNESREDSKHNLCYFCDIMFAAQGDLIAHMGSMHLDYFPHIQQDDFLMTF